MQAASATQSFQENNIKEMEEKTTPPPKPQRGVLRHHNPVIVPPSTPTPGAALPVASQFKGIERRKQLLERFQQNLPVHSSTEGFSGREGMDAMIATVEDHATGKTTQEMAKGQAVKLLDLWLQECIIRPKTEEWSHEFQDDKRVIYLFNPPEMFKIVMTPRIRSASCERKPSRRASFKSLFKFGSQDQGESRPTLFGDNDENKESPRLLKIRTKALRVAHTDTVLNDEAHVFELALRNILLEVDIPILDEVLSVKDCRTQEQNVSFLSSILRRMGLASEQMASNVEEVLEFVKNCVHLKRTGGIVVNWFHQGFQCAPDLCLEINPNVSKNSQIHEWINTTLKSVADNYANITNNGRHPLIPAEFVQFTEAICQQLCSRNTSTEKRDRVLHYLWLMIPSKLRRHLSNVLNFIQATAGTDSMFNFHDPFFVSKQVSELGSNFWYVLQELRPFIVPQMPERDQISIIEMYLNIRKNRNLEHVPDQLRNCKKLSTTVFCHGEKVTDHQEQQQWTSMVEGIMKTNSFTPKRKKEMLQQLKHEKPELMKTFFPDL